MAVRNLIFDLQIKLGQSDARLKALEKRFDSAVRKLDLAKKGTLEYAQAERELAAVNAELSGTFKTASDSGNSFDKTMKSAAKSIGTLIAVGGGVNILRDGVSTIREFELSLSQLSSITGATGKDLEFYEEQAKLIGSTTTLSASQAVNAFKLIGSAKPDLLKNKQALADVTKEAVTLAEASGTDLPIAAESLAGLLNQYSLSADQAARATNALAAGQKEGSATVQEQTDAISKFGPVAAQNNITIEESIGLVETLAEKSIKGSEAGTKLRVVISKMSTIKALPEDALKQLEKFGVDLDVVSDSTLPLNQRLEEMSKISQDSTALLKVFGEENQVAGNIILNNVDKVNKYTEAVTGTNVANEQAAINTNNLDGSLKSLQSKWEAFVLSFSESSGILKGAVDFLTKNLFAVLKVVGNLIKVFVIFKARMAALKLVEQARNWRKFAKGLDETEEGMKGAALSAKSFGKALKGITFSIAIGLLLEIAAAFWDVVSGANAAREAKARFDKANADADKKASERIDKRATSLDKELNALERKLEADVTAAKNDEERAAINKQFLADKADLLKLTEEEIKTDIRAINERRAGYREQKDLLLSLSGSYNDLNSEQLAKIKEIGEAEGVRTVNLQTTFRILSRTGAIQDRVDQLGANISGTNVKLKQYNAELSDISESSKDAANATLTFGNALESEVVGLINSVNARLKDEREALNRATTISEVRATQSRIKRLEAEKKRILGIEREKAGTIAALQSNVSKLRDKLTNDLTLDSDKFAETVETYIAAQAELDEAQKRLKIEESPILGSIDFAQQQVTELREVVNSMSTEADEFQDVVEMLFDAENKLEELRKLAERPEEQADGRLDELQEEQRHQEALASIQQKGAVTILQLQVKFAEKRLELLRETNKEEEIEVVQQKNKLEELQEELDRARTKANKDQIDKDKEKNQAIIEGVNQVVQASLSAVNTLLSAQLQAIDSQISRQQGNVEKVQDIAEKGNAELLELEEERLDKLQQKREKFVRAQQALAAIELVANSAVAISKAAAQGGVAAPFTIAATLIALGAGLAQARALASQSAFFEGGYTGDGGSQQVSRKLGDKSYTYHNREFVMDSVTTHKGQNRRIFGEILRRRMDLGEVFGQASAPIVIPQGSDAGSADRIVEAIKGQPGTVFKIDKDGFVAMYNRTENRNKRIDSKR